MTEKFFKNYFNKQKELITLNETIQNNLYKTKRYLEKVKKNKSKVMIFGNGGSAAIANHFSVDLTKNSRIRCVNYNESSHLTCFANDYGYENWVKKSLEFHADPKDLIILISSSGESKNMINACNYALKRKLFPIITLTGFKKNNSLSKLGHINYWVDSKTYNLVENSHQIILLSLTDATKK